MRFRKLRGPATGSYSECQECKTICRSENIRERISDGVLVCPACNYFEPQRFATVDVQAIPHLHSPITKPEHPPSIEQAEGFDMRANPDSMFR